MSVQSSIPAISQQADRSAANVANCKHESVAFRKSFALPPELYRNIICFMDDDPYPPWITGVQSLVYVSRTWRSEAEKYLYTYVDVPPCNLLAFCRTILSRPDLALRVRKLRFQTNGDRPRQDGDLQTVAKALHSLHRLRDLHAHGITSIGRSTEALIDKTQDYWIFLGSPFRLYRFITDFDWSLELVDFVTSQPELRVLAIPDPLNDDTLPAMNRISAAALPECRCMSIEPNVLCNLTGSSVPSLTHLRIEFFSTPADVDMQAAKQVGRFGDSLRVLALVRGNAPRDAAFLSPASMLSRFAKKTPRLTFLGIWDWHFSYSPRDNRNIFNIVTKNFPELKVFVWAPPLNLGELKDYIDPSEYEESGWSTDADDERGTPEKVLRYASKMLSSHPTLEWFVAGGFRDNWAFCRPRPEDSNIPRAYGPLPFEAFVDQEYYSYIDPDAPFDYIASMRKVINPLRFGSSAYTTDYDSMFTETRNNMMLPEDYPNDGPAWREPVISNPKPTEEIPHIQEPETAYDLYMDPVIFRENSDRSREIALDILARNS